MIRTAQPDIAQRARELFGDVASPDIEARARALFTGVPAAIAQRARAVFGPDADRPKPTPSPAPRKPAPPKPTAPPTRTSRHDPAAGVVRDVLVVTLATTDRRYAPPDVLRKALRLYEGASVFVDHDDAPTTRTMRPVTSSAGRTDTPFGVLRGVYAAADGSLRAKRLEYDRRHSFAASFAWLVANDPDGFGLSCVTDGRAFELGGVEVVKRIDRVHSVDLVANPAHGGGLFRLREQREEMPQNPAPTSRAGREAVNLRGPSVPLSLRESTDPVARLRAEVLAERAAEAARAAAAAAAVEASRAAGAAAGRVWWQRAATLRAVRGLANFGAGAVGSEVASCDVFRDLERAAENRDPARWNPAAFRDGFADAVRAEFARVRAEVYAG